MELIIDKNGIAVDLEDVSVTIVYESKEEADRMKEAMADGRAQFLEWHPIEVRDGKVIGDLPEVGQDVILTLENGYVTVDTFPGDYENDGFFWEVRAWAAAQPYEKKRGRDMNELDKLEAYLKERGYRYERIKKDADMFGREWHQIIIYDENDVRQWDAVCAPGSYGYEAGLLEVTGEKVVRVQDSAEGYLRADEVIKRLEEENNESK